MIVTNKGCQTEQYTSSKSSKKCEHPINELIIQGLKHNWEKQMRHSGQLTESLNIFVIEEDYKLPQIPPPPILITLPS